MSNLIPEQRMDKNGKLVTRHIKNGPAQAPSSSLSIAPPSPISYSGTSKIKKFLREKVPDQLKLRENGMDLHNLFSFRASNIPEETATRLVEAISSHEHNEPLLTIITAALHHRDQPEVLDNITVLYDPYIYQEYEWDIDHENQEVITHGAYESITRDIRGIQRIFDIQNLTEDSDQEDFRTMNRMFELSQRASQHEFKRTKEGHEYSTFKDARAETLILDNLHQSDAMLDLAYETDFNVDLMIEKLKVTTALRDGAL